MLQKVSCSDKFPPMSWIRFLSKVPQNLYRKRIVSELHCRGVKEMSLKYQKQYKAKTNYREEQPFR